MASAVAGRKTVTVLFCDLAESTALGERLDPEPLRLLLARWYEAMRAPLERHGGTVEKFIGDAVMAVFGVPVAHEDDALRAVRAAVEMRDAAAAVDGRLAVRIGVNTGEVVVGDDVTTLVTGDAVNTAKRLEEAAGEAGILIGDATRRLVENAVELEPVEPVVAKGKQRAVTAWRVVATIPDAPAFARRLDAPLVGRAEEVALLHAELERAERDRSCRIVTVLGQAGVGKSRLATELVTAVRDRATVLTGRCPAYGDGITFLPLHDLVRSAGGHEAVRAAVADEPDAELIVERLADERLRGDEAVSSEDAFWAVRRTFEALSRARPLVVCLEDVHWAAPRFLDLIEYVVGWSRDAPVLLVCLSRPELVDERPRWPGVVVELEPLSDDHAAQLIEELAAEWPLSPAERSAAVETAEGNPLYLEQLVAMLAGGGAAGRMPPTIQALLTARLDALAAGDRAVLERAAVVGREFRREAVVELSPEPERAAVGGTLLRLVRQQLVDPSPSRIGEDAFRFRHVLIRDAAYAGLAKAARAELHERFADWLEREGDSSELVGYHLEQAYRYRGELGLDDADGLGGRAGELLAAAGRRARTRDDLPAAANLLERAAALLPERSATRGELLPELASVLMKAGDFPKAEGVLDEALALARAAGDRRLELRTLVEQAFFRMFTGAGATSDEIVQVAAGAIPELEELGDDLGLAKAWRLLSEAHVLVCRWGKRAGALERALEYAARGDDPREVATLRSWLVQTLQYGPTPVDQALERVHALLAEAEGDRLVRASILSSLAVLHAMREQFDAARSSWAQARDLWDELGMTARRGVRSIDAATIELLAGDPDAAVRELQLGDRMLEEAGDRYVRPTVAAFLAAALAEAGRDEQAELLARFAEQEGWDDDVVTQVMWRLARAEVRSRAGEPAEAERLAREAVERARPTDFLDLQAAALLVLAQVLRDAGSPDATRVAAEARAVYERKGNRAGARRAAALGRTAAPA